MQKNAHDSALREAERYRELVKKSTYTGKDCPHGFVYNPTFSVGEKIYQACDVQLWNTVASSTSSWILLQRLVLESMAWLSNAPQRIQGEGCRFISACVILLVGWHTPPTVSNWYTFYVEVDRLFEYFQCDSIDRHECKVTASTPATLPRCLLLPVFSLVPRAKHTKAVFPTRQISIRPYMVSSNSTTQASDARHVGVQRRRRATVVLH